MRQDEESTEDSDDQNGPDGEIAPPTTALAAALKDQVQQQLQQFQQTMTLHLQNLAHFPQMPALPGMAMLPDYQAYLQRVQQLMPGMSGTRPGSAGENQGKMDGRWWDISSYMNNNGAVPPPAYEDIFPQKDLDRKQESAIRAAADAEADMKCATLYDQSTLVTATATTTNTLRASDDAPEILKIGRKNAITKEQQEQFLRAREIKLKSLRSDRNLFFIWVSTICMCRVAGLQMQDLLTKFLDSSSPCHGVRYVVQLLSLPVPFSLDFSPGAGTSRPQQSISADEDDA
jgi:hypothetical protein